MLEFLFISAVLLNIINFHLLKKTVIPPYIILLFYLTAIPLYPLLRRRFSRFIEGKFELMMYFIVILGSYTTFSLLSLNMLFSSRHVHVKVYSFSRVNKRMMGGVGVYRAEHIGLLDFENGVIRKVNFTQGLKRKSLRRDSLRVHLSEGLLKFPIIHRYELHKKTPEAGSIRSFN